MQYRVLVSLRSKNSAAYIMHWRKFIESDVKAVISAASKAERACDYILNRKVADEVVE